RIALAKAYTQYAWKARGDGMSDTVSQNGWKLFADRLQKARETLEQAASLSTKDPEWYAAMQSVSLGESWDLKRSNALFEEAIKFEPVYDAFYRNQAVYLRPQWNGEKGDSAKVAEQGADRIGGSEGDILYFQVAKELVCTCDESEFNQMSFARVQKGFD